MNKKVYIMITLLATAANHLICSAADQPINQKTAQQKATLKTLLLNEQELEKLVSEHPDLGAIGQVQFIATEKETADMVCTMEKPKKCFRGYPEERAEKSGWLFKPENTFKREELVLVPHDNTKYILGVVLQEEEGKDATYTVQIGINSVVYVPAHDLGKPSSPEAPEEPEETEQKEPTEEEKVEEPTPEEKQPISEKEEVPAEPVAEVTPTKPTAEEEPAPTPEVEQTEAAAKAPQPEMPATPAPEAEVPQPEEQPTPEAAAPEPTPEPTPEAQPETPPEEIAPTPEAAQSEEVPTPEEQPSTEESAAEESTE